MAILFGVLALVGSLFGAIVFGWGGVGAVALFAALAVLFQVLKNKKLEEGERKKKAGIVLGIIGVVIVLAGQLGIIGFADSLKADAEKLGDVPIVVAGAEGMKKFGFMGFAAYAVDAKPEGMSDDDFADEMKRQLDRANSVYDDKLK